jgi:magnesium-transporting ATPase (P-type)
VVGDVVMLNSGATVQADGILCAGRVAVDQSPLTGESEEKQKIPSPAITDTGILTPDTVSWDPGKDTQLFRGSRVCQGEGEMLVCRVGDRTLYGGVASGLQEDVRKYVFSDPDATRFLNKTTDLLRFLIPRYAREGKHYLTIGIGCTGGQHRSVTLACALYDALKDDCNYFWSCEHRDIKDG